MKTIATTAMLSLTVLFSGLTHAAPSSSFKLVANNEAKATNLCVMAVEEGVSAMTKQAEAEGIDAKSLICNGKPIARFVKKYKPSTTLKEIFAVSR